MTRPALLLPLLLTVLGVSLLTPRPAAALDDAHWLMADQAIDRGIAFLRSTQNEDGSWSPEPGPAITALVVDVMLTEPDIDADDPTVAKGLKYILSKVNDDGSIHSGILANYNTSICLSALVHVRDDPEVASAVANAEAFLKGLQWKEGMQTPEGETITKDHPYYGGVGYGGSGRPDGSNMQYMIQAMYDAGVDCQEPVFQRALVYINRLQGHESNDMFADQIVNDGGFIYATTISKDHVGVPESKANPQLMAKVKDGEDVEVTGLRTYGSMTYAQFKSMIYAQLDRNDPRVKAVRQWISNNWTLEQNPGMPVNEQTLSHLQGLYYYYMSMSRALDAWGTQHVTVGAEPSAVITAGPQAPYDQVVAAMQTLRDEGITEVSVQTADDAGEAVSIERRRGGKMVDWENELVAKLVSLQKDDGSWTNKAERWYEGDPNLATAYALIALQAAIR